VNETLSASWRTLTIPNSVLNSEKASSLALPRDLSLSAYDCHQTAVRFVWENCTNHGAHINCDHAKFSKGFGEPSDAFRIRGASYLPWLQDGGT